MNRMFDGACRKLGIKRVQYRKRETCFKIKAMGLTGKHVADIDKKAVHRAVDELVKIWNKEDAFSVVLNISATKGIRVQDKKGNELFRYKIYNVANCTISDSNPEVFLFVGKQRDKTTNCHAFYCSDQFQAEAICLAMSNAFHKAFEAWMERKGPTSGNDDKADQSRKRDDVLPDGATNGGLPDCAEKEDDASEFRSSAKINARDSRTPSTLSEASTFSFGSQADEAFAALIPVPEEDMKGESHSRVSLLRRSSYDWGTAEENIKVLSLIDGEDVDWEEGQLQS